jgi:hypothetical protein
VQQLLQIVAILVILLILLRVSLRLRGKSFGLRGRITTLNIATGALSGLMAATLVAAAASAAGIGAGGAGGPGAADPSDAGYSILIEALRSVMPFAGAIFGGLAGYLLLGTVWQWLVRSESTTAQAWLRRAQIAVCLASLLAWASRLI